MDILNRIDTYLNEGGQLGKRPRMNTSEVQKEALRLIKIAQDKVNIWAVRDTVKNFTTWGFWNGENYVSIDDKLAKTILTKLATAVKKHPSSFSEDIIDQLYRFG